MSIVQSTFSSWKHLYCLFFTRYWSRNIHKYSGYNFPYFWNCKFFYLALSLPFWICLKHSSANDELFPIFLRCLCVFWSKSLPADWWHILRNEITIVDFEVGASVSIMISFFIFYGTSTRWLAIAGAFLKKMWSWLGLTSSRRASEATSWAAQLLEPTRIETSC
jgi:hypothetical protein